jgi:hypothetical protein
VDRVFISYAREDRQVASSIYTLLKENGFNPWIDFECLLPGDDWEREIDKAIRESAIFIACLSTRAFKRRGFVHAELQKALRTLDTIPDGQVFLVPVRLDECEVPARLARLSWLDYFRDEGPDRLVRAVSKHLEPTNQDEPIKPGDTRGTNWPRRKVSVKTKLLLVLTVVSAIAYVGYLFPNLTNSGNPRRQLPTNAPSPDGEMYLTLQESLIEIKNKNYADAYGKLSRVVTPKKDSKTGQEAAFIKVVLALSYVYTQLQMAELLRAGYDKASKGDKGKFMEWSANHMANGFTWADKLASSVEQITSSGVPEVSFDKVDLAYPLGSDSREGLRLIDSIKDGQPLSDYQLGLSENVLVSQTFRYYMAKSFQPDAQQKDIVSRDIWQGKIQWSPGISSAIYEAISKVANKGIEYCSKTEGTASDKKLFLPDDNESQKEVNVYYFRNMLQILERFFDAIVERSVDVVDKSRATNIIQSIQQQLTSINKKFRID